MSIYFMADSGSDIPQGSEKVKVLPLAVSFGDEHFQDGVDLSHEEFYQKLTSGTELPITSQATPYQFTEAFEEAVEAGNQVIVVTISSKLSGTFQSASIAAAEFPGKVFVVDSLNVSVGQRALIDYGISLAETGHSAEEIVEILEKERENIHLLALLDTLEYLKRGGRISATTAFAGSLLSIKPVVMLREGEVVMCGKARGSKQGNNLLVKEINEAGGVDFSKPYYLGYTGNSTELLDRYIKDSENLWKEETDELPVMTVGGAVGTHIGPGAIALAFFKKGQ